MANGSSKSKVLKNAQKVANESTLNAAARKEGKHRAKKATTKTDAAHASAKKTAGKKEHKKRKKLSAAKKALIVCIAAIIVVVGCCCFAFASIEESRSQYVPDTTMLDGQVDISGLTEGELRELLATRISNNISTTLILSAGDSSHEIPLADIGTIDIDATVNQAFAPYRDNPVIRFFLTAGELITGAPGSYDVSTVCAVNREVLAQRVSGIAKVANTEPTNAGYAYDKTSNALVVAPAKQGVLMDEEGTVQRIEKVLGAADNGDPARLVIEADAVIAEAGSDESGQGIFVDTRMCRVALYEDGVEVVSYPCTPGTSGYATPTGDFYLSYKDPAPSWYNPHSDWSEGMEEVIGPGPSNPLGVRALAVSCGGGIFIHGTTSIGGLGSPGSHGCVRLSNNDIIDLYNRVSEGIPIIIR